MKLKHCEVRGSFFNLKPTQSSGVAIPRGLRLTSEAHNTLGYFFGGK